MVQVCKFFLNETRHKRVIMQKEPVFGPDDLRSVSDVDELPVGTLAGKLLLEGVFAFLRTRSN